MDYLSFFFSFLGRLFYHIPKLDKITREFFNDPNLPSISELELKTCLLLLNSHESMSIARPQMPNTVYVGGIHVKEPKPLPEVVHKQFIMIDYIEGN